MPEPADRRETPKKTAVAGASGGSHVDETVTATSRAAAPSAPEFDAPAEPGEVGRLGPYRIVKELGRGGMGAVYAAIDTRLGRRLALKVMLPEYAANAAAKERFLREACAAANIKHDNVVTVYEADERDGVPYIAMEFLEGSPLDEYLKKKGSPSVPQILRIARETASGLAAAHQIGLIHRDIKPGNLWLEAPQGRVKVLDFGLAKPVDADVELTQSGAIVGTPAYMSPEQARGQKLNHRSDLFSLGAVLYRLCAGKLPFNGPTTMAVLMALGTEEPEPVRELNPSVPAALAELIHALLAKNPDARPQTAEDVIRRLNDVENGLLTPTANAVETPSLSQPQVVYVPLQMAALPAAENPFADIDADDTEFEDPSASATPPKAERKQPRGKGAWIVAGVATLLAAVVVAGVVTSKNKDGKETKIEDPQGETVLGNNKEQTPPTTKADYSLQFDGKQSVVAVPGLTYDGTTPITVEATVLVSGAARTSKQSIAGDSEGAGINLGLHPDGVEFGVRNGTEWLYASHNLTNEEFGAPLRLAGVFDGKELRLYVNGSQVAQKAFQGTFSPSPYAFSLGASPGPYRKDGPKGPNDGYHTFAGVIDDVRISKVARTAAELKSTARLQSDKDTLALYLFNEGRGEVLNDSSGNKRAGKIIDAAWVKTPWTSATAVSTPDADRKAAEWVLSVGGRVKVDGAESQLGAAAELPKARFALTGVDLRNNRAVTEDELALLKGCKDLSSLLLDNLKLTDRGLAHFKDCTNLTYVGLTGTQITDTSLAHFKECKNLTYFDLHNTGVTDAGLAHLKECGKLRSLGLSGTGVTDAGLTHLKGCTVLAALNVKGTKVSANGAAALAAAVPGCRIEYDGGIIEPKVDPNPDRAAAEYALSLGGFVRVNGAARVIIAAADLPKDRFTLTLLNLTLKKVTDAGLAHFKNCKHLTRLDLSRTQVTDVGLAHFKDCKDLTRIDLNDTQVTDAGLAFLAGCKSLTELDLCGTKVSDAGLAQFKELNITWLCVRSTKVTAKGLADFHAAVPGCKIEHDGGKIEALEVDHKAAEWIIAQGGAVGINKVFADCKAVADLPKSAFTLRTVDLRNTKATDADLARLKPLKKLTHLYLTDAPVSDAGLKTLVGCDSLTHMYLKGTKVTAAAAAHLKDFPNLRYLDLDRANVPREELDAFRAALPACYICYDGSVIEPKKK